MPQANPLLEDLLPYHLFTAEVRLLGKSVKEAISFSMI
jgi:hypothetical protein